MFDDDRQRQFIALYVDSERSIRRLVRVLVWDVSTVDDVCQAVALRLWELFDRYDPSRSFRSWALGITSNVALELNRSRRRAGPVFSPDFVEAVVEGFERSQLQQVRSGDQLDALEECLGRLASTRRDVIEMRYVRGLSVSAIADDIGKTVDMTYKLLHQAKQRLAECIRRKSASATNGRFPLSDKLANSGQECHG